MQRIIDFIIRFKEYVTLSALIILCFLLMSLGNAAELPGFRTVVIGGIGITQDLLSWVPNPVALQSENKALRDLNYNLSREVARTRKALIENDKLKVLLELKKQAEHPMVNAEVIGKVTTEMRNYITLNAGRNEKIEKGMSVQTDRGLVGHIMAVSDNYSMVQLILNRDARISVKIERSRIDGIIVWEGGEYLLLKDIAKTQDVQAGDVIVTSGYSTMYPADVYVGRVHEVRDEPNSLFRHITVTPAVNFTTLEEVFVSLQQPAPERLELEKLLHTEKKPTKK